MFPLLPSLRRRLDGPEPDPGPDPPASDPDPSETPAAPAGGSTLFRPVQLLGDNLRFALRLVDDSPTLRFIVRAYAANELFGPNVVELVERLLALAFGGLG